uniref:Glycosyl transferase family 1 domain-containing protein n=1 Tax=viral metagenome TaxID=1070528 RepID=A0A6C0K935_9ZZZZ
MKVVFFAQIMPDPCGAFFHDVAIAKELQRRGHTVSFVTANRGRNPLRGVYRGLPWVYYTNAENELNSAGVWSTPHFPIMKLVRRLNERFQKPLVTTMHFGEDTQSIAPYARAGKWTDILWIISDHIRNYIVNNVPISPTFKIVESIRPAMIENEIKFNERGAVPTGNCITLINANMLKGLPLFIELAGRFPDRKFLGVRPYYNNINVPENIPNIEWINLQDDIRIILARTRILIVPSFYESWGRVAFEAMYNGIPVIYTKPSADKNPQTSRPSGTTEGMQEWIGDSQYALSNLNVDEWVDTINQLDDVSTYAEASRRAYQKTYDMNVFADFNDIERKFQEYAVQFAVTIENSKAAAGQQGAAYTPQLRFVPPSRGSAMPFRGGRFAVRR